MTSTAPPTFMVAAMDDPRVSVEGVMLYSEMLHKARVPCELHIYPTGGHGFGLRPTKDYVKTWPCRAADWMQSRGLLNPERP